MADSLYLSGARICRVGFFGIKMPIGLSESLMNNLVNRYLEFLAPKIEACVLQGKSVFDIGIVTPTNSIELFSFGDEQRVAKKFREGRVHSMCKQQNLGSLCFRPTKVGEIKLIKMYLKLIHIILSVIARNYLDDMPATMSTIRTRFRQLRELLVRLELMEVTGSDHEILGTRLEVTVQGVNTVQVAR